MEFVPKMKVELENDEEEEDQDEIRQRRLISNHDLRLYLIRRTVLQMLRDRGYLVGDMEIAMSREDFWEKFGSGIKRYELDIVKVKRNDPAEQIFVFFPEELKVGVTVVKRYAELMKEHKVKLAILVVQKKPTLFGQQSISTLTGNYSIEVFQEAELLVNVMESCMVPEHRVLSDDKKKTILERFNSTTAQMPRLLTDDPVARYYGLRKGQMVKIIRAGQAKDGGDAVSYRLVH